MNSLRLIGMNAVAIGSSGAAVADDENVHPLMTSGISMDVSVILPARELDLTPPEQERIAKIAEALRLRPELILGISGMVDREADGLALRTAKLEEVIEARIESGTGAGSSDAMYTERRSAVIEAMYREAVGAEEGALDETRARHTTQTTDPESGRPISRFDRLAYTVDLSRQLIDQQVVTEDEFVALSRARVDVVRAAMIVANAALAERIRTAQPKAVEADDDSVRMDVTLKAGS